MKEIGGYFELECGRFPHYHSKAYRLCSGSAGLRLIIRTLHITKLHVPEYTCPVVWDAVRTEKCECLFYQTGADFLPAKNFPSEEYVLYNNYFGICSKQTRQLAEQHPRIIIDNAQAFYMPHCGIASLYSPHKFFGIPDGGFLSCNFPIKIPKKRAISWHKCSHLLKRYDLGANAGYEDFKENGKKIQDDGISRMSLLTEALMGNIDYNQCKKKRIDNFLYLHEHLQNINHIRIQLSSEDVPMVYPLLLSQNNIRKKLIDAKVYVAQYWPGIPYTKWLNILPLPIDQRYGKYEMDHILEIIK